MTLPALSPLRTADSCRDAVMGVSSMPAVMTFPS
jgi:hypothetical protein